MIKNDSRPLLELLILLKEEVLNSRENIPTFSCSMKYDGLCSTISSGLVNSYKISLKEKHILLEFVRYKAPKRIKNLHKHFTNYNSEHYWESFYISPRLRFLTIHINRLKKQQKLNKTL